MFAFSAQAHRGQTFFRRIILLSENFVTMKFFYTYTILPVGSSNSASWSSAVFKRLKTLSVSIWVLARCQYYRNSEYYPRVLPDPAGPLSSELSPSPAADCLQQAKTKKRGPYVKFLSACVLHGVFIRWLHPPLPGDHLALWVKKNSAKFLC